MVWLPILVHLVFAFHLICAVAFLARNPELLVIGAFKMLDLVPQYASYASERMANQVAEEVRARFR